MVEEKIILIDGICYLRRFSMQQMPASFSFVGHLLDGRCYSIINTTHDDNGLITD